MKRTAVLWRTCMTVGIGIALLVTIPWLAFQNGRSLALDRITTNWLHAHAAPWLTAVMKFVSTYAYHNAHWYLIGAVGLFFLLRKRSAWELLYLLAVRFGSDQAQELIKAFYARPRPVLDWVKPSSSFSYPSGTVTVGAAVCLALAYLIAFHCKSRLAQRAVIGTGWALAVLVAVSRIYLGAHWLTDTLGALSLATAIVTLAFAPLRIRALPALPEAGQVAREAYAQAAPSSQQ